jgi:esterase/lipase superfamily enzyme
VPEGQAPSPSQGMARVPWYNAVRAAGEWANEQGEKRGDILIVIHGYNVSEADIMQRHRLLRDDLKSLGFKGTLVSFDWPCGDSALAYLDDRHHAKDTAMQLVSDGIVYLSKAQRADCPINVHVLGHSTGAYVIREAFDDADDTKLENGGWRVSQVLFIAGDVSAASMSSGDKGAASIYGHGVRMTNYWNRHDQALDISNVKRVGIAPRVGRIGLPADAPSTAVNVDCTPYYEVFEANAGADQPGGVVGIQSHSWYFGNMVFARDLFQTLIGIDRTVITTRGVAADGHLILQRPGK